MYNGACLPVCPNKISPETLSFFCNYIIYIIGMKLRKVECSDKVKKQEYDHDVAFILKRRIFLEISDSSGGESGSDSSDSELND